MLILLSWIRLLSHWTVGGWLCSESVQTTQFSEVHPVALRKFLAKCSWTLLSFVADMSVFSTLPVFYACVFLCSWSSISCLSTLQTAARNPSCLYILRRLWRLMTVATLVNLAWWSIAWLLESPKPITNLLTLVSSDYLALLQYNFWFHTVWKVMNLVVPFGCF